MSTAKQILIVGAGIGGLTTAIRLAAQGHRVRVFERQEQAGGKLNQIVMDGFTFDTGPSLITMPHVFHDLFRAVERRLEDYLDLVPLELTCRYFYRDGLVLNAWREHARLAAEFAHLNACDAEALDHFLDYGRMLYQAAADPFLYHSLEGPLAVARTFWRYILHGHPSASPEEVGKPGERLRAVLSALAPVTLDWMVRRFFTDKHLRQLFDRYATYNGSSPYRAGAVYSIIPYVELADGGWYLRGGIYTLTQALERLACEFGVTIETGCAVRRILVQHGAARGLVLADGRVLRSDLVVANSDVVTTQRELLAPGVQSPQQLRRLARLEPSSSGVVLLLGTNKRYPQLAHHNILFSNDYPAEFADLFERRQPLQQPTIYICATTRTDPSQAPEGHENLFVLVNAPYLTEKSSWRHDAPTYREHLLDLLVSYPQAGLADLREHIVCEAMLTPEDFYQRYGANAGSIYGLSSNARMAPFQRPGNRSAIRRLYFVGGSTHPGGGVPLVMLSGKIVAELIAEDIARGRL